MIRNVRGAKQFVTIWVGEAVDDSSVAQTDVWFSFLAAAQQPLVVAWFAFGLAVLIAAALWVNVSKQRSKRTMHLAVAPRSIGAPIIIEPSVAQSA